VKKKQHLPLRPLRPRRETAAAETASSFEIAELAETAESNDKRKKLKAESCNIPGPLQQCKNLSVNSSIPILLA
jgi:hypothetical protein